MARRVLNVSVCPGEPTDGSGRACIHLFVRDAHGPFVEPHVLRQAVDDDGLPVKGQLMAGPARGRLACSPTRTVSPTTRGNVTMVTLRTDDARAVTCPKCMASGLYARAMELLTAAEAAM